MKNRDYLIETLTNLQEQMENSKPSKELSTIDKNVTSWGYEEGFLISYNQAKAIIKLLREKLSK